METHKGLCTHFQLVLLARDNNSDETASEEPLSDFRVHIAFAIEDFVNFIDALNGEKLIARVVSDG